MQFVGFKISEEALRRVDAAAGGNRSAWLRGVIEREVGSAGYTRAERRRAARIERSMERVRRERG